MQLEVDFFSAQPGTPPHSESFVMEVSAAREHVQLSSPEPAS
jgi:hypothetical protein